MRRATLTRSCESGVSEEEYRNETAKIIPKIIAIPIVQARTWDKSWGFRCSLNRNRRIFAIAIVITPALALDDFRRFTNVFEVGRLESVIRASTWFAYPASANSSAFSGPVDPRCRGPLIISFRRLYSYTISLALMCWKVSKDAIWIFTCTLLYISVTNCRNVPWTDDNVNPGTNRRYELLWVPGSRTRNSLVKIDYLVGCWGPWTVRVRDTSIDSMRLFCWLESGLSALLPNPIPELMRPAKCFVDDDVVFARFE